MAPSNADMATDENTKTAAQLLQEQHEAAAAHHVTVEDVVDEDETPKFNAPSPPHEVEAPAASTNGASNGVMSTKAAGKQKARDTPPPIDTESEELFPTLGSGPKPRATPPLSWGKKLVPKPNGEPEAGSRRSSTSSTPGHGTPVAAATPPMEFGRAPGSGLLPGQIRDSFVVANADIDSSKNKFKILQDIMRKLNVKVEMTQVTLHFQPCTRFTATGNRQKSVDDALKTVSRELTKEQSKSIQIPAALKSHIIGRSGANVAALQKKHDVKIQLQDRKEASTPGQASATVEIKGRSHGVAAAEQEILGLIKERQPRIDLPLPGIPQEFFPFIASQHGPRIQHWEDRDVKVHIPEYGSRQKQAPSTASITVSGDHEMAPKAHAELEQVARRLQEQLKRQEETFDRSLHPFIVGHRGMSQQQFMEETGCVLILPDDDSEDITIIGPEDRLQEGAAKAMELAASISRQPVDVHKPFVNAPRGPTSHSRALAHYLREKQIEQEFRKAYDAEVMFPSDSDPPATWNIFAQDNMKAMQARAELIKIVQAYPPERLSLHNVDPFFHPHLDELCTQDLRQDYNVQMIIPPGEDHVILVYEGDLPQDTPFQFPRQRPSAQDLSAFDDFLRRAEHFITKQTGEQTTIHNERFEVPKKYHDKVRKFVATVPQPAPPQGFPVRVGFGNSAGSNQQGQSKDAGVSDSTVFLSGHQEQNVKDLMRQIKEKLDEIEEDEKTRSYKTTFAFPDKFKNFLIGKQGASINPLMEQYDVKIDTKEPEKVTIQGPQKHAEACKAEITRLGKQWADEVTHRIKIDPRFFGSLIGKNGVNMTRLREKTDNTVTIQLPQKTRSDDTRSIADGASEAGSHRNSRANQAPDEIVVRGPRKKADEIRSEIEELYKYEKEQSHEATVSVAKDQIRSLMGKGGSEIEKLRRDTNAKINIPNSDEVDGNSQRVTIKLQGTKDAVEKAKIELQKRSKTFDAIVTRKITIDQKFHRNLIGSGGSNIKRIVADAGGPENSAEAVQFSKQGSSTDEVTISGTADIVASIEAALKAFVLDKENETTETIDVPDDQHHKLIGRGGETRQALEAKYKVKLDIPRRNAGTTIKIAGGASDVAAAKEEILKRTAKPAGEAIDVPKSLHHTIGNNGQLFRELRGKKVVIDHGGQKPPPKPSSAPTRSRGANGSLPLITDEDDSMPFQWDIVDTNASTNGDAGTIPWILSGPPDQVSAAIERIEKAIEAASQPRSTGYLILSDPALHRHIIGRGGSKINEIRNKANCDIQVPKGNSENDAAITIVGEREACEEAKTLILEAVRRGESGGNGAGRGRDSPRH